MPSYGPKAIHLYILIVYIYTYRQIISYYRYNRKIYLNLFRAGVHHGNPSCFSSQRRSIFIEEVEDEERRKVKVATSGPATLTSLIAQQQKARDSRQVFLHVDVLNCGGVFVSFT